MWKNLILGPVLACLPQIWNHKFFFLEFYFNELLNIVRSYYQIQFKVRVMNEAWENGKKS